MKFELTKGDMVNVVISYVPFYFNSVGFLTHHTAVNIDDY